MIFSLDFFVDFFEFSGFFLELELIKVCCDLPVAFCLRNAFAECPHARTGTGRVGAGTGTTPCAVIKSRVAGRSRLSSLSLSLAG